MVLSPGEADDDVSVDLNRPSPILPGRLDAVIGCVGWLVDLVLAIKHLARIKIYVTVLFVLLRAG